MQQYTRNPRQTSHPILGESRASKQAPPEIIIKNFQVRQPLIQMTRPGGKLGNSTGSEEDATYYTMSAQDQFGGNPYDITYANPELFWRGDTRDSDAVFGTGFLPRNELDKPLGDRGHNIITWRDGGGLDDILPASAVCLAKDIRGGTFFPLSEAGFFYLYAVAQTQVVSTFNAQKDVEEEETHSRELNPERFKYDPAYEDCDNAAAIWQFQEYASHQVENTQVLACYKVEKNTLIPTHGDESVSIAGIRFKLTLEKENPLCTSVLALQPLYTELRAIAAKYSDFYPASDREYLSYMGLVRLKDGVDRPGSLDEAGERDPATDELVRMEQLNPLPPAL